MVLSIVLANALLACPVGTASRGFASIHGATLAALAHGRASGVLLPWSCGH